jgi:F-type H+-transporting ATPase subunit delta
MVVAEKHRLGSLPAISAAYDELLDKQLGKVEVDVIVAQRLTPDALETVRRRVSAALKRDAVVHPYVDESIIGGMILRVQDQLIDGSIRTQLKTIRQRMIAARPK